MANTNVILFNARSKNHSWLSNDYLIDMTIDGKSYYHVEGFFQAAKYLGINDKHAERLRCISSPIICRKVSDEQIMTDERKEKWNNKYKLIAMRRAVYTKFITNNELARQLLSTRDATLVYQAPDDDYWGNGKDTKGNNMLGKILEETRDIIGSLPDDE